MAVLGANIIKTLQYRIQQEELSSRLYLAMSIWLDFNGFSGAAKKWKEYSQEEMKHADWVYNYLIDLNIMPVVPVLPQPQTEFRNLPTVISMSYDHEVLITNQCKELAQSASNDNDFMTLELAQRFLKEQVEELGKIQYFLDKLETFGTDEIALRLLDNEMGG